MSTSGQIFLNVLRVVLKFWKAKGHKIIIFLDDRIGGRTVYEKALVSGNFARETLLSLFLAKEKCQWMPKKQVAWLGHKIDMSVGKLFITEERMLA